MVLPIFGLLAGAGVLGARAFYENTASENPSYINQMLGIQAPDRSYENLGQVNLAGVTAPQQLQALAAQADSPEAAQYLFNQARQMVQQQQGMAAQILESQQRQAREAEARRYARQQDLLAREDAFRNRYISEFRNFAGAQSTFQALENTLANGSAQDAVAATFQIMKTLDPTSTVRTEEGRQVMTADGAMAGLANELNKLMGEGWNESTRRGWYETVSRAYRPQAERTYRALQDWGQRAQEQGFAASALSGAGIDRERLRATVEGSRTSPFPPREPPQPEVREDENYIYTNELPTSGARTRRDIRDRRRR